MEKILIADDEQLMRQLVIDFLRPEGYEILEASDGKEALEIYDKEHPDLILLDVMMPGYDGWTVCREIRRESTVPIMMLTAKGEEIDQLFAYDLGADEYITKPFSPKILVAKIKALLRRSQNEQETHEIDEGVAIDRDARQVVLDGKNVDLSPTEYKLLNYLMSNTGKALSRRQILNQVWNYDYYGDLRTVDTHINRLRIKLGDKGRYIRTVRGYGYRYDGKVLVTRSIKDVNLVIPIIKFHYRSRHRDTTLFLNLHPVGCSRFLNLITFYSTRHLNLTTEKQQLFRQ